MKKILYLIVFILIGHAGKGQELDLTARKANALTGSQFAHRIGDTALSLEKREKLIYREVRKGNIPDFLRRLTLVKDSISANGQSLAIQYYVVPDYFAIGNNEDYFYIPMTPILAQRIANLLHCSLPTKKMVDAIYQSARIKLSPSPIPPSRAMTTVPAFIAHNNQLHIQLQPYVLQHTQGALVGGHKKDIIISNKIYTEKTAKVVIYGWHQLDGKAIQPVYNKHTNLWADYSHGIRYIQNMVLVNGKPEQLGEVLKSPNLNALLSDEGIIPRAFYPITKYE